MPENQAVLFWGLILGVLRILLFQGRAESPMERLAQGKRSGTLGWVIVSKTIYALKGQKRGYCAFVSHTQSFYVFTLLPFQGVDMVFLFHIPRVPLRLPWASYVIHQILDDFFVLIYVTVTQHKPKESTHNSHQIFSRLEPLQPKFSTACFWCY